MRESFSHPLIRDWDNDSQAPLAKAEVPLS
jgi:hypothetical protein